MTPLPPPLKKKPGFSLVQARASYSLMYTEKLYSYMPPWDVAKSILYYCGAWSPIQVTHKGQYQTTKKVHLSLRY